MANYRSVAAQAARRYGLDTSVFLRQIGQESGFNPHALSPAGAIGIAQFEPATARGLGINPRDPVQALYGAAKLMAGYVKRFGSYRDALVAYNAGPGVVGHSLPAETRNYIATILGGRNPSPSGVSTGRSGRGTPGTPGTPGQAGALLQLGGGPSADLSSNMNAVALLEALGKGQQQQAPQSMPLAAPSFTAGPKLAGQTPTGGGGPAPQASPDIGSLLSLVQTPAGAQQSSGGTTVGLAPIAGTPGTPGTAGGGVSGRLGKVSIAAGANKPGTSINPAVINFVRQIAGAFGRPLTIGTGTNHSRLTINGTVSDHASGNAADIPLTGKALIRAGQDALIAAGMPASKARKITGGGFNVGHYQVIFNTDAPGWGNHLTHLHVGRRAR